MKSFLLSVNDSAGIQILEDGCEDNNLIACHRFAIIAEKSKRYQLLDKNCSKGFVASCSDLGNELLKSKKKAGIIALVKACKSDKIDFLLKRQIAQDCYLLSSLTKKQAEKNDFLAKACLLDSKNIACSEIFKKRLKKEFYRKEKLMWLSENWILLGIIGFGLILTVLVGWFVRRSQRFEKLVKREFFEVSQKDVDNIFDKLDD